MKLLKLLARKKFVIVAFALAVVMALSTPITVLAANVPRYVSDIAVVTKEQIGEAKSDGWTVIETPLYQNTLDASNGAGSTYLAFKTTNVANDAITDIRAMNMNGGWSFAEYENLLKTMTDNAKKNAYALWPAVQTFRLYAKNMDSRENVKYAYDLLNILYDDDVLDANGKPMRVGDLLLDETLVPDSQCEIFTTLFLQSNMKVLQVLYTALMTACAKNSSGQSFLEVLNDNHEDLEFDYMDDNTLDGDVYYLASSIDEARDDIAFYRTNLESYESLAAADEANGTTYSAMYLNGKFLCDVLSKVAYNGTEGQFETLLDLFTADLDELTEGMDGEEKAEYMYQQLRPIVAAMTSGQRCVLQIGFSQLVNISNTESGHYYDVLNDLKSDPDRKAIVDEGISVFYGVDREVYKDHYVALTSAALRADAEGDQSWQQLQDEEHARAYKLDEIAQKMAIGCGVGAVITGVWTSIATKTISSTFCLSFSRSLSAVFFGSSLEIKQTIAKYVSTKVVEIIEEESNAYYTIPARQITYDSVKDVAQITTRMGVGIVLDACMAVGFVLSIAGLIASLVLFLLPKNEDLAYTDYVEIPAKLCDNRATLDEETLGYDKDNPQYVYYDCALNPVENGVRTTALFNQNKKDAQVLPVNKKPSMDIFNWELRGDRQWLCLYYTKNRSAGRPILADSLKVGAAEAESVKVAGFSGDGKVGMDLSALYNRSIDNNPDADKSAKAGAVYISYLMDLDAVYTQTDTDYILDALGSAVGNGAAWLMSALGLGLGCAGGIAIGKHSKGKKDGADTAKA